MKTITIYLVVVSFILSACFNTWADSGYSNNEEKRIQYIQQSLDEGSSSARLWWNGWVGFYSAATVISLAVALTSKNEILQITGGVSAGESLIGLSGMLIFPFKARTAAEELRSMPESTPEQKAQKLAKAELLLKQSSDAEIAGKSWMQHFLGVLVNAAGASVVWPLYEDRIKHAGGIAWQQALELFVVGTAVSELQIWTEPTRAIYDEKDYKNKYADKPQAGFMVLPVKNGLTLVTIIDF